MANHKKVAFDLANAGCYSCKSAIEHAGRHIDGIFAIITDNHIIHCSFY